VTDPTRAPVLVWHRGDLRLHDHAAVHAAVASGGPVIGVVVLDPVILDATSQRRRALFHAAAASLGESYARRGGLLLVRSGDPARELAALAGRTGSTVLHALRSHTPYGVHRDAAAERALANAGVVVHWHDGLYVHAPGRVLTRDERPFSVYSAYARRWSELDAGAALDPPTRFLPVDLPPGLSQGTIPLVSSDVPLPELGESAALRRYDEFLDRGIDGYAAQRDRLDGSGSARLSIDFTLGILSPRFAVQRAGMRTGEGARKWISEVVWRDFMADLLWHRPHLIDKPFDARYSALEWNTDEHAFAAWRDGETGIPVSDAAMRELRATGWIGNRARMVAAQFLTRLLRVDWRLGERVFRDWLLDGDVASNVGNWHWAAGLGIDNAPYFRVFNPVTQGRQHDPDGSWLRRWVPECDGDPHPLPNAIVDPAEARRDYLAVMESL
jgi:deoxyribodipyrimidine photo-lyase